MPFLQELRRPMLRAHRWLGLGLAIFWVIQAVTGVLIVFHWEIDDALLSPLHRPTDLARLEDRLAALAAPGSGLTIESIWATGGLADRYDIFLVDAAGQESTTRVAGDGTVLRQVGGDQMSLFDLIVTTHQTLLAGRIGRWIVLCSSLLLFSTILIGLWIAAPRRGGWGVALKPLRNGPRSTRLYSWHRALGLIAAIPALALVAAGAARVFDDDLRALVGVPEIEIPARPSALPPAVGFAEAAHAALIAMPGARLVAIRMPTPADATYRIRLLARDDIRRAYGTSVVYVDAGTGALLGTFPAATASPARAFLDSLYPLHTGEIFGSLGRVMVMAVGVWLFAMTLLGISLWVVRRRRGSSIRSI